MERIIEETHTGAETALRAQLPDGTTVEVTADQQKQMSDVGRIALVLSSDIMPQVLPNSKALTSFFEEHTGLKGEDLSDAITEILRENRGKSRYADYSGLGTAEASMALNEEGYKFLAEEIISSETGRT